MTMPVARRGLLDQIASTRMRGSVALVEHSRVAELKNALALGGSS